MFSRRKLALWPQKCRIWMTHRTKKRSRWFLMRCKHKTHLCKSHSREDDFSSKLRWRRAVDEFPACVTRHRQLRMQTATKQTNSHPFFVLVHKSKSLCYLNDLTWLFCKQAIIKSVSMSTPVLPTPAVQWTTTGPAVSSASLLELILCLAASNSSRNSANETKQFKRYKTPQ